MPYSILEEPRNPVVCGYQAMNGPGRAWVSSRLKIRGHDLSWKSLEIQLSDGTCLGDDPWWVKSLTEPLLVVLGQVEVGEGVHHDAGDFHRPAHHSSGAHHRTHKDARHADLYTQEPKRLSRVYTPVSRHEPCTCMGTMRSCGDKTIHLHKFAHLSLCKI